jgi:hypothetical protein
MSIVEESQQEAKRKNTKELEVLGLMDMVSVEL